MSMEELESEGDLSGVEASSGFVKLAGALDLEHEVSTVDVLHNEEEAVAGLEAGVERGEEGVLRCQQQNPLLSQRAVHVVVLDYHVFLQHLKRINL